MAQQAAVAQGGWTAALLEALDNGVPLQPEEYRTLLDTQVLGPAGELHPDLAALNSGLPAPAARVVQQVQGGSQTLPDIIESCFVPMVSLRRSVLVFEPRGQRREEREARKRQRSTNGREEDVRYEGAGYSGRFNFSPSGAGTVPVIAKRTTKQTRTKDNMELHFLAHEVRRVVPNPGAPTLQVAALLLEDSGVAELRLAAGGERFSGSTQIVLLAGLPAVDMAGQQVSLSGWYAVNPSGCGKLAQPSNHFRIKLPKRAAAAAAQAIQEAVQQRLVSVEEGYVKEDSPIMHHLMLASPPQQAPAQQPQAAPAVPAGPPQQHQQAQQAQQPAADALDPDGMVHQGSAAVTGELWAQGQMVVSDAKKKENIRAFDQAKQSLDIVTQIHSYLFEYKGTSAPRVGLLAQQVLNVLKKHEADGLNIVKADSQGSLAIDFAALQTLCMSALKQVHADTAELRRSQNAFQLMVLGRLETLAAAQQAAGGGLEVLLYTDSGAGGTGAAGAGSSGGGSSTGAGAVGGGLPACPNLRQFLGSDEDYDMATSESGEEEGQQEQAGGHADEGELSGMTEVQAAYWLMAQLREQAGAQKLYLKLAGDLSLAALWETYQAALATPPELIADGTALRMRTLGGVFIKLAKKRIQAEKLQQKATAQGTGPVQLRGYQQRLVEVARSGGNFIFVAPTNSGKTAVALEHAAHVLSRSAAARVVFVAPTVALATQQAAAFCVHPSFGPRGFAVGCFTSDNPIAPRDWRDKLQEYHVIVLTPQILVNALDAGEAHFSQLSLLVLDECHHATGKHAMNQLLRHYHSSRERTQRAVPDIEQTEVVVQLEAADDGLARRLGAFVVAAVELVQRGIDLPDLPGLSQQVVSMLLAGGWSAAALRWTRSIAERLQAAVQDGLLGGTSPVMHDATSALGLVRAATAALALVSDVGFEAAVRHLSGEYFKAAREAAPLAGDLDGAVAVGPLTAALLARLADEVVEAQVLEGTFSGGMTRHPKFQALLTCRAEAAQQQDSWHAIVFARTREAVRTLAALLQGRPELPGVQVHALMGHGGGAAAGGGMSSKQQQAALEAFRQPGRQLLVSTAAGEEGIDVPLCELVVRYAATQTGRERLQSAGRARKHGSRFVEIIGATASELALVHKSRREEENLRKALQALGL